MENHDKDGESVYPSNGSKHERSSRSNVSSHCSPKIISDCFFVDVILNIKRDDSNSIFCKLGSGALVDCYYSSGYEEKHKGGVPESTSPFRNRQLYYTLDITSLQHWVCDFNMDTPLVLPDQYLSSDILRILFDYLLNGPHEGSMHAIVDLIRNHLDTHPPCLTTIRDMYKKLLFENDDDCYFKTELSKVGLFMHVLSRLEELSALLNVTEPEPVEAAPQELSLELLEQRWNNFEPLVEREYNATMAAIDRMAEPSNTMVKKDLSTEILFQRLITALELIVHILEQDFLICVGKLKRSLNNKTITHRTPLIQPFIFSYFNVTLNIYIHTKEKQLWIKLSRLIGLMIETEHIFYNLPLRAWKYPNTNEKCLKYVDELAKAFITSDWDNDDKIERLQFLLPHPWLQQRIAMACTNAEIKANMGFDLKAIVDIIHLHVKNSVSQKTALIKVDTNFNVKHEESSISPKKSKNRNQFGESPLLKLCKHKHRSLSDIKDILRMPDCDVNEQDNYGWTALHEAVNTNGVRLVEFLLNYKPPPGKESFNIVAQNLDGITPLHEAVHNQNLRICELLVQCGGVSILRIPNNEGVTPLDLAKRNPEIQHFFEKEIHKQEKLNLRPDSELCLSDHIIILLKMALSAFNKEYRTKQIYDILKHSKPFKKVVPQNKITIDNYTIDEYNNHLIQFGKLKKIISNLAKNPDNSPLIMEWDLDLKE